MTIPKIYEFPAGDIRLVVCLSVAELDVALDIRRGGCLLTLCTGLFVEVEKVVVKVV